MGCGASTAVQAVPPKGASSAKQSLEEVRKPAAGGRDAARKDAQTGQADAKTKKKATTDGENSKAMASTPEPSEIKTLKTILKPTVPDKDTAAKEIATKTPRANGKASGKLDADTSKDASSGSATLAGPQEEGSKANHKASQEEDAEQLPPNDKEAAGCSNAHGTPTGAADQDDKAVGSANTGSHLPSEGLDREEAPQISRGSKPQENPCSTGDKVSEEPAKTVGAKCSDTSDSTILPEAMGQNGPSMEREESRSTQETAGDAAEPAEDDASDMNRPLRHLDSRSKLPPLQASSSSHLPVELPKDPFAKPILPPAQTPPISRSLSSAAGGGSSPQSSSAASASLTGLQSTEVAVQNATEPVATLLPAELNDCVPVSATVDLFRQPGYGRPKSADRQSMGASLSWKGPGNPSRPSSAGANAKGPVAPIPSLPPQCNMVPDVGGSTVSVSQSSGKNAEVPSSGNDSEQRVALSEQVAEEIAPVGIKSGSEALCNAKPADSQPLATTEEKNQRSMERPGGQAPVRRPSSGNTAVTPAIPELARLQTQAKGTSPDEPCGEQAQKARGTDVGVSLGNASMVASRAGAPPNQSDGTAATAEAATSKVPSRQASARAVFRTASTKDAQAIAALTPSPAKFPSRPTSAKSVASAAHSQVTSRPSSGRQVSTGDGNVPSRPISARAATAAPGPSRPTSGRATGSTESARLPASEKATSRPTSAEAPSRPHSATRQALTTPDLTKFTATESASHTMAPHASGSAAPPAQSARNSAEENPTHNLRVCTEQATGMIENSEGTVDRSDPFVHGGLENDHKTEQDGGPGCEGDQAGADHEAGGAHKEEHADDTLQDLVDEVASGHEGHEHGAGGAHKEEHSDEALHDLVNEVASALTEGHEE